MKKALKTVVWVIVGAFSIWAVFVSVNRDKTPDEVAPPVTYSKDDSSVQVVCQTTKGELDIVVKPAWSPLGAARFLQLVDDGFFTNLPLFRCMQGFVCQFGPTLTRTDEKNYPAITDDPARPEFRKFKPGYLSFAGFEPNSRATNIFIALAAVDSLGAEVWETPFGYVTDDSMQSTASHFETTYGESAPSGTGPDPDKIEAPDGAEYLKTSFPLLDYFQSCTRKK